MQLLHLFSYTFILVINLPKFITFGFALWALSNLFIIQYINVVVFERMRLKFLAQEIGAFSSSKFPINKLCVCVLVHFSGVSEKKNRFQLCAKSIRKKWKVAKHNTTLIHRKIMRSNFRPP